MSRLGLGRVWSVLGALLALYAAGTWIILQGGKSFAEVPGLEARSPVISAYQAVLIVGTLLGVLSAIGIFYIRGPRATSEPLLPVVGIADVGPHAANAWSMRLYQGFFFLAFLLVPAVALFQLNDAVLTRGVLWHQDDAALGGITVKNAYAMTHGRGGGDPEEYACRGDVKRADGFVWLANTRCDIAKSAHLKPFDQKGKSIAENANSVGPSCTRNLAVERSKSEGCENPRDISEECEASERRCRGMQWLPILSPLSLVAATMFGWIMFTWLSIEACYRIVRRDGTNSNGSAPPMSQPVGDKGAGAPA